MFVILMKWISDGNASSARHTETGLIGRKRSTSCSVCGSDVWRAASADYFIMGTMSALMQEKMVEGYFHFSFSFPASL